MKRVGITGCLVVAVVSISAAFAASALATAKLTLKAGGVALASGAKLTASAPTATFTTSAGAFECTTNTILSTVSVNGSATDTSVVSAGGVITEGVEELEGKKKLCRSSTPFGPVTVEAHNFNWLYQFKNKCALTTKCALGEGEAVLKPPALQKLAFSFKFPAGGAGECFYEAGKVVSKFPLNSGSPTLVTKEQVFKSSKTKSNLGCPKEAKLNGEWFLESGGKHLETENK
jgi:hypothetical protein